MHDPSTDFSEEIKAAVNAIPSKVTRMPQISLDSEITTEWVVSKLIPSFRDSWTEIDMKTATIVSEKKIFPLT